MLRHAPFLVVVALVERVRANPGTAGHAGSPSRRVTGTVRGPNPYPDRLGSRPERPTPARRERRRPLATSTRTFRPDGVHRAPSGTSLSADAPGDCETFAGDPSADRVEAREGPFGRPEVPEPSGGGRLTAAAPGGPLAGDRVAACFAPVTVEAKRAIGLTQTAEQWRHRYEEGNAGPGAARSRQARPRLGCGRPAPLPRTPKVDGSRFSGTTGWACRFTSSGSRRAAPRGPHRRTGARHIRDATRASPGKDRVEVPPPYLAVRGGRISCLAAWTIVQPIDGSCRSMVVLHVERFDLDALRAALAAAEARAKSTKFDAATARPEAARAQADASGTAATIARLRPEIENLRRALYGQRRNGAHGCSPSSTRNSRRSRPPLRRTSWSRRPS